MRRKLLTVILCSIGVFGIGFANDLQSLIITGKSGSKQILDLTEYNRVSFQDDFMTVSSADEPTKKIELLYSLYQRLEFGEGLTTGITDTEISSSNKLCYDGVAQSLILKSNDEEQYVVGIFNIDGHLLYRSEMRGYESISLEFLDRGIFLALAIKGDEILKIKFIK